MKVEKVDIKELWFTEQLLYWNDIKDNKIKELEEENRNLKNELMEDMKTESKLNEEIRNLKSELSKFRDSFKKYRDYEKEELADRCYDLARENQKLKEEIGKLVMNWK